MLPLFMSSSGAPSENFAPVGLVEGGATSARRFINPKNGKHPGVNEPAHHHYMNATWSYMRLTMLLFAGIIILWGIFETHPLLYNDVQTMYRRLTSDGGGPRTSIDGTALVKPLGSIAAVNSKDSNVLNPGGSGTGSHHSSTNAALDSYNQAISATGTKLSSKQMKKSFSTLPVEVAKEAKKNQQQQAAALTTSVVNPTSMELVTTKVKPTSSSADSEAYSAVVAGSWASTSITGSSGSGSGSGTRNSAHRYSDPESAKQAAMERRDETIKAQRQMQIQKAGMEELRSNSAAMATAKRIDASNHLNSKMYDGIEGKYLKLDNSLNFHGNSENTTSGLTKVQCFAKYGQRKFLTDKQKKQPPMLYTFPGSGNTWGRLLIEYATSVYTGSVFNDKKLLPALPGEFSCNWQVSAVKVHPHTHKFNALRTGNFKSNAGKCQRGNVRQMKRAILLIRDPFDSIWSEFQRRITQSHVGGVLKQNFDWYRWQANAAALSHEYNDMWKQDYSGIEKHFKAEDILYVRFEDLRDKKERVNTLRRITDFLSINADPPVTTEKLECAFLLADKRSTHREVDADLAMTKMDAYTPGLVCRMWALFGQYASKHNYHIWNNINCSTVASGTVKPIPGE